jgi:mRNA (guanine-N7-)-methyltransferase
MKERTTRFGNDIYGIAFDQIDSFPKFGARYMFHLEDAVDSPEYLVHVPTLEKSAAPVGCVAVPADVRSGAAG